jgi:uridine monophosphate synthetase
LLREKFILDLFDIGAVKFGTFKLKSGIISPFYLDFREIVSYPEIMNDLATLIAESVKTIECDQVSGIPYTALPIATLVSQKMRKPLIYARKEVKSYGTGKKVEGQFKTGDRCLVIDDVMSTGESKIEAAKVFAASGLSIAAFVVVVDRSFAGKNIIEANGYKYAALYTIADVTDILLRNNRLDEQKVRDVHQFLQNPPQAKSLPGLRQRKSTESNPSAAKLIDRMLEKKSNIVASIDISDNDQFLAVAKAVAPHVVMIKTHMDVMQRFDDAFLNALLTIAKNQRLFIFEDRKFADIGNTVRMQFHEGIYKIADWADYITVHGVAGPGILAGLFGEQQKTKTGGFLLARMSAKDNLIDNAYTEKVLAMGIKHPAVTGYIGHGLNREDIRKFRASIPGHQLLAMPGVQLKAGGDELGQQYLSVEEAMLGGADLLIVGRGIYRSSDPAAAAEEYKNAAWQHLQI